MLSFREYYYSLPMYNPKFLIDPRTILRNKILKLFNVPESFFYSNILNNKGLTEYQKETLKRTVNGENVFPKLDWITVYDSTKNQLELF